MVCAENTSHARAPTLCDAASRAARTEALGVCQRPVRDPGLSLDCPSLHRAGATNGSHQGEVLDFRGSGIICILRLARWTGWTWSRAIIWNGGQIPVVFSGPSPISTTPAQT